MGKLIYLMIASLDGFVSDAEGNIGAGAPAEDMHEFINEQMRSFGTHLYGRRMYEVMSYWETADVSSQPSFIADYAGIWQAADKVVYSTTLTETASERTRLEPSFDPDEVRRLKAESELDLSVSGPTLAAAAMREGLVDEFQLFLSPTVFGGGKRFFPADVRLDLELLDERRFGDGTVYLHYAAKP